MARKPNWRDREIDPNRIDHHEIETAQAHLLTEHINRYVASLRQFAVAPTPTGWTITSPREMEDQPMPPKVAA